MSLFAKPGFLRNENLTRYSEVMNEIEIVLRKIRDTKALEFGVGAMEKVPSMFEKLFPGKTAVVVADNVTYDIAGKTIYNYLEKAGVRTAPSFIFTDPGLYAEWAYLEQLESYMKERDVIAVAVGVGVINDLTKLASSHLGRRYIIVGTAASMDGYTAYGASITYHGNKQTFDCRAPLGMVMDPAVVAKAPNKITASGYGDLIAKISSGADWIIADGVGSESIDEFAFSLVQQNLSKALADPDAIASGDVVAVGNLAYELIMSGFAMQSMLSSRPASGAEHLFSHYWDMEGLCYKGRHVPHGFSVAIGTLVSVACLEFLLKKDFSTIDIDRTVSIWPEWEAMEEKIREVFDGKPEHLSKGLAESKSKYIDKDGLRKQLGVLKRSWPELRQKIQNQIIPFNDVRERLKRVGAPYEPEMIGVNREKLRNTFRAIPYMRNRFTNIDLIHRTGLMDEAENYIFGEGGYYEC